MEIEEGGYYLNYPKNQTEKSIEITKYNYEKL